jgi:aspartate/methionine/tyrosine aminotransferase
MSPDLLNPLLRDTGTPPIPEAKAWLGAYDGRLGPVIDLSQAVPSKPPHPDLLARIGAAAADAESARYGPILGDATLREALARDIGGTVGAGDVAITSGCNQAFVVAMMALAKAGDRVILPAPWYFNHEMTLGLLGIEAVPLPCAPDQGFVPQVDAARALIDARTRAVVLVTPNNPTGAVYPAQTIHDFAELCRQTGIALVLDETYRDFLPEGQDASHALFAEDGWRGHVMQLYSFSKAHAVPGHRLGALTADKATIDEIAKILDCLQICPPRTAQGALAWAIEAQRDWREANRRDINAAARAFRSAFAQMPDWRIEAVGAYFAYVRHPFAGERAGAVAERMARERGVLALPGPFFGPGQEGHLRMAFANVSAEMLALLPARLAGFTS